MTKPCEWCGATHAALCPKVKAIEYHSDGTTKRVEFFSPSDYGPPLGWQMTIPIQAPSPMLPTWKPVTSCAAPMSTAYPTGHHWNG